MFVDVKTHLHKLKVAEHVNFPVVLQGALSFVTKTHSSFAVITKLKILLIDGNGKNSETRTLFYNLQEFWFPCVFHLFFFIYISRCDKSNKTGSYFYCSFPHFECLTGGSSTLTDKPLKSDASRCG